MRTYFVENLDQLHDRLVEDGVLKMRDLEIFDAEDGHGYGVLVDDIDDSADAADIESLEYIVEHH